MKIIIFSIFTLAATFPLFAETGSSPLVATLRLSSRELFQKDQLSPKNKKALDDANKKDWDEFGDPLGQDIYRVDMDGNGTWEYVILQEMQNFESRLFILEGEDGRIIFKKGYGIMGEDDSIGFTSLIAPDQKEILVSYKGGHGTGHFGFVVDVLKKKGHEIKKIFQDYFYYYQWEDEVHEDIHYIALTGNHKPYDLKVFDGTMKTEWRHKTKNGDWDDDGEDYKKLLMIPIVRKSENDKPKEIYLWDTKDYEYRKKESKKVK